MTLSKLGSIALPLLAAACSVSNNTDEAAPASATEDMTSSWFASNLPAGSAAESAVLALVNDPNMSMGSFVSRCGFSESQAASIVSYRAGDELASSADDQRFDTLAELDALPFTDAGFWAAAKSCAAGSGPVIVPPPPCSLPPVVIELVVDTSGSMTGEKWEASRDALIALVDDMSTTATPNVLVGALLFNTAPARKVKPGSFSNAAHRGDLIALFDGVSPSGGTATMSALESAYDIVEDGAGSNPGAKRVVVLLSDGIPDSPQQGILDLVTDKQSATRTFSVGIGAFPNAPGYDPAFMGRVAQAGGTAPVGCDPASTDLALVCHHQITPGGGTTRTKEALSVAFRVISAAATASASCP